MPRHVGRGEAQTPGAAVTPATTWLELPRQHVLEWQGMYVVQLLGDRGAWTEGPFMLGALGIESKRPITALQALRISSKGL